MIRKFTQSFHVPGELTADLAIVWTIPTDCSLVHVSAVVSDANAAGLEVGTTSDADAYIKKFSTGISGTPVEKENPSDFDGATADSARPHIADGTLLKLTVDFNYNGGGSAAASEDITIVLTFQEG